MRGTPVAARVGLRPAATARKGAKAQQHGVIELRAPARALVDSTKGGGDNSSDCAALPVLTTLPPLPQVRGPSAPPEAGVVDRVVVEAGVRRGLALALRPAGARSK